MANIARLINANQHRWEAMHFKPNRLNEIEAISKSLIAHKAQYEEISKATGVPWAVVGVIDQREHEANLGLVNSYLGNGQSLNHPTTIVPIGRGPFLPHPDRPPLQGPFYRGALDALLAVQKANTWHDWSPGGALTFLEGLNGYGYADMGKASPYIWGATTEQEAGKYVADHVFDPNVWDTQLGCAAMLRYMSGLDPSAGYGAPGTPIPVPTPVPVPVPVPPVKEPPVATPPATVPPIDFGAIFKSVAPHLLPILPVLLGGIPGVAPFVPVIEAAIAIFQKIQAAGGIGNVADLNKLIADELRAIANALDPPK